MQLTQWRPKYGVITLASYCPYCYEFFLSMQDGLCGVIKVVVLGFLHAVLLISTKESVGIYVSRAKTDHGSMYGNTNGYHDSNANSAFPAL
ncbi:hypothetical protein VNO77_02453 [Canavalia gladiata]|uniref:Uncharacterized protein n=1 Tax=Canavalia gladiata TaxID=3824 RepID=A0AAN9MY97_CANGL